MPAAAPLIQNWRGTHPADYAIIVVLYCDITHLRTVVQLSLDPVFHRSRVRCI